jgi:hypothetical protein
MHFYQHCRAQPLYQGVTPQPLPRLHFVTTPAPTEGTAEGTQRGAATRYVHDIAGDNASVAQRIPTTQSQGQPNCKHDWVLINQTSLAHVNPCRHRGTGPSTYRCYRSIVLGGHQGLQLS